MGRIREGEAMQEAETDILVAGALANTHESALMTRDKAGRTKENRS